ncbi:hypothetical protein CPB85DRAFT_349106 [Mucidula mucida]|nr:hypothetical protein CPB85DRAFT_349106 [Mucidula mucida]
MNALAAEQFRMHNSTDIFSDEKICPSCTSPSPLIYGDDGNGENITVKDLSEERLERLLKMKCTNCARSFCRGCSKRTDTVCLTAGTCAQKCSCAIFEILSAYDQDVLKHLGNSENYEAYLSKSCVAFCDTLAALMRYVDPMFTSNNATRPRRSDGRGPAPNVTYLIHSSLLANSIRHLLSKKSFSDWILIRSNLKMYGQLVKFLTGMIDEWGYPELALLRVCRITKSCGLRKWMHREGDIEFGELQDPLVDLLQPFVDKNGRFMSQGSKYLGQNGIQLCESLARLSEAVENLKADG